MLREFKKTAISSFLFVCSNFLAIESTYCSCVNLLRIEESAIEKTIPTIKKSLQRHSILRYAILGTAIPAGVAISAYTFYQLFFATSYELSDIKKGLDSVNQGLNNKNITTDTFVRLASYSRQLTERLEQLMAAMKKYGESEKQTLWIVKRAKGLFNFGVQAVGSTLLLNFAGNAQRYCSNLLKPCDLKWFVTMKTHLGAFINYTDQEGIPHERFNEGSLLKELKNSAKLYDEFAQSDDLEKKLQSTRMLSSVCSSLTKELTVIIAFMRYKLETDLVASPLKSDAECYAQYLIAHANSLYETLEQIFDAQNQINNKKATQNEVQKFIVSFKDMITGFVRVAEESTDTL